MRRVSEWSHLGVVYLCIYILHRYDLHISHDFPKVGQEEYNFGFESEGSGDRGTCCYVNPRETRGPFGLGLGSGLEY